jgi:hypothetical protein
MGEKIENMMNFSILNGLQRLWGIGLLLVFSMLVGCSINLTLTNFDDGENLYAECSRFSKECTILMPNGETLSGKYSRRQTEDTRSVQQLLHPVLPTPLALDKEYLLVADKITRF